MSGNEIDEMLNFDPLWEAEKISGKSYKEDEGTSALGMLFAMAHGDMKSNALANSGDTHMRMSADYFFAILAKEGFVKISERNVKFKYMEEPGDKHYIFVKRDEGLLINFDTYRAHTTINGGNLYFNWEARPGYRGWPDHCSGGYSSRYWDAEPSRHIMAGSLDIREGLIHNLTNMRANGVFLKDWVEQPFLWLLSHADTDNEEYDYEKLNADRIASFPGDVIRMVSAPRG